MTIHQRRGDLLAQTQGILVHGCNARGVMGAGVAKAIRDRWPQVYTAYRHQYHRHGLALGSVIPVTVAGSSQQPQLMVANAITQDRYGSDPTVRYVDYAAVATAFAHVAALARRTGLAVHFPLIGCGLANGRWSEVAAAIETGLGEVDGHLWCLDPPR